MYFCISNKINTNFQNHIQSVANVKYNKLKKVLKYYSNRPEIELGIYNF